MAWYTCPLKAGHAGTTSLIFHVLTKIIMFLDVLTNTYLDLRESKDGVITEPISEKIYIFCSRSGVTTCKKKSDISNLWWLLNYVYLILPLPRTTHI